MKTIIYFFIAVILLTQSIFSLQAQNTEGKEFWVTFGQQRSWACCPFPSQDFQIRIVGGNMPTEVTLYFTKLDESVSFNIDAYEIYTYSLTLPQKEAVHNTVMAITNNSIHITSNERITVFVRHFANSSYNDVTNVLPIEALGTEYYQISYTGTSYDDAYAIVATQNNTLVWHDGALEATLQTGEVYYRTSNTDMTGAHITSNNPVAFFALHKGANIPFGVPTSEKHIMQQMAPVNTWDDIFFVPVTVIEQGIVRIVVSQNNTNITQLGGIIRTGVPNAQTSLTNLQAGQFIELEFTSDNIGCYVLADKRVGVCTYLTCYPGTYGIGFHSMAAQTWVPGIKQTVSKALMAPFTAPYLQDFALIVTPTATKNNTKVSIAGGVFEDLKDGSWIVHDLAGMSFYNMPLTESTVSYVFTNQKGIIIFGYGVGNQTTLASYYYLAYSAMRDLDAAFYANDIHFQDLKDNPICESEITFRAEIEGKGVNVDTIKWYIDGVEDLSARDEILWDKPFFVGNYEIKMWVHFEDGDTISKSDILIVKFCDQSAAFFANNVPHSELKDTTFCNKNVNFRAEIEGLHPTASDSIMWYINDIFETSAATWSRPFENGTYEIKLVVHYDNDTYATLTGTLKIQALWIKIRNVRY